MKNRSRSSRNPDNGHAISPRQTRSQEPYRCHHLGVFFWTALFSLPLIALFWPTFFTLKSPAELERFKSTLGQLGTYGDMFGALNCLFSGAAMIGVAYAVILQRRDTSSKGSDPVLQPIMPLDLPVKVRSWELTVYPRSHIRR